MIFEKINLFNFKYLLNIETYIHNENIFYMYSWYIRPYVMDSVNLSMLELSSDIL